MPAGSRCGNVTFPGKVDPEVELEMRLRQAMPIMFAVTACVLAFEVSLTRVCAVLLQYHVSFAVVSLAVLGLGIGGFVAYAWTRGHVERLGVAATYALIAVSPGMWLALFCLLRLPFAEYWTFLLALVLPVFVATGAFQSLLLRALARQAGFLYGADLAGGAAGALAAVVGIDALGGPVNTVLLLSLLMATAAWVWVRRQPGLARGVRPVTAALAVVAFGIILVQGGTRFLDVRYDLAPSKLIHQMMRRTPGGVPRLLPELQRWDAYSRVDVLELRSPRATQRLVFIDGETPTAMLEQGAPAPGAAALELENTLPALPYRLLAPGDVLAIGAGAGYDVAIARRFGAQRVDAVELNAGVLDVVRQSRDFTGDVYGQEGVRVHHAEGRRFVRAAEAGQYDLVVLLLAQSLAGNLREYALSENYLYTREAFADYMRVLRPGGAIALLVSDAGLQRRLHRTAAEVLQSLGVSASAAVVALASPRESPYDRLLLVRNRPFTPARRAQLRAEIDARGYGVVAPPVSNSAAGRAPGEASGGPTGAAGGGATGAAGPGTGAGTDATDAATAAPGLASMPPATDDRPFVFHVRGAIPRALRNLLITAATLLLAAWVAVGWVGRAAPRQSALASGYFVLLGIAFMMVEVLVLQKAILVIGYPTLNLAVVLATFLLAAGLGSAASSRVAASSLGLRLLLFVLGAALLALVPILEAVHARCDAWSVARRCWTLAGLLFPFAFLMGMPFPLAIRHLPSGLVAFVPWVWGLNGVGSILGSALVVAVVLEAGFRATVVLPALAYTLAAALSPAFASGAATQAAPAQAGASAHADKR